MDKKYKIGQWFFDFNYDGKEEEFTISRHRVARITMEKAKHSETFRYYDIFNVELHPEELYESLSQLKRSIFNSINSLIKRQKESIREEAPDEQG